MSDERLNDVETRVAFQDETIQKLDDALADQQKQIMDLRRMVDMLAGRLADLESGRDEKPEPPPPHY